MVIILQWYMKVKSEKKKQINLLKISFELN